MLHSRQLQVVSPCVSFAGTPATADRPAYCTHCEKHVHDLSRLSEKEIVGLLARHLDGDVCISYELRDDGSIVTREKTRALAPAALALSLAGCAGHMGSGGTTRAECVDAQGYEIDCPPTSRLDVAVIPGGVDAEPIDAEAIAEEAEERAWEEAMAAAEAELAATEAPPGEAPALARAEADDPTRASAEPEQGASCVISDRVMRKIYRPRRFIMGKPAIPSREQLCLHEAVQQEAERLARRERRQRERAERKAARGR